MKGHHLLGKRWSSFLQSSLTRSNKRVSMGHWLIVPFWRRSIWIMPRAFQISVAMTLLVDRLISPFCGAGSPGETYCFDSCLDSCVMCWVHVSFTAQKTWQNCGWTSPNTPSKLHLWFIVSKFSTQSANDFLIHKWFLKIVTTKPCSMPRRSTISCTFNFY